MNTKIIVSVMIIAGTGIANAWSNNKPITAIVLGSYILLLVLSVMDMFGNGLSQLASAIALLAMTYVVLTEFPWKTIIKTIQGN